MPRCRNSSASFAGSHRTYADPIGHPFCLYPGNADRLWRVVIDCPDAAALSAFYAELLGADPVPAPAPQPGHSSCEVVEQAIIGVRGSGDLDEADAAGDGSAADAGRLAELVAELSGARLWLPLPASCDAHCMPWLLE